MQADRLFAKRQLERLLDFPGVPEQPESFADRVSFLAEVSRDNEHCQAITERLLRSLRYFPLPVDIEAAAEAERVASEDDWASHAPSCRECHDTGWRITSSGVVRCGCVTKTAPKQRAPAEPECNWPKHPEMAIEIPPGIVTGKTYAAREKFAKTLTWYNGPLTLGEAVDMGRLSRERARSLVEEWESATGQTFRVVLPEKPRLKPAAIEASAQPAKSQEVA